MLLGGEIQPMMEQILREHSPVRPTETLGCQQINTQLAGAALSCHWPNLPAQAASSPGMVPPTPELTLSMIGMLPFQHRPRVLALRLNMDSTFH